MAGENPKDFKDIVVNLFDGLRGDFGKKIMDALPFKPLIDNLKSIGIFEVIGEKIKAITGVDVSSSESIVSNLVEKGKEKINQPSEKAKKEESVEVAAPVSLEKADAPASGVSEVPVTIRNSAKAALPTTAIRDAAVDAKAAHDSGELPKAQQAAQSTSKIADATDKAREGAKEVADRVKGLKVDGLKDAASHALEAVKGADGKHKGAMIGGAAVAADGFRRMVTKGEDGKRQIAKGAVEAGVGIGTATAAVLSQRSKAASGQDTGPAK